MNRNLVVLAIMPFIAIAAVTALVVRKGMTESYQGVEQDAFTYLLGGEMAGGVHRRPGLAVSGTEAGPFGVVAKTDAPIAAAPIRLRLTFILISEDQRIALINGAVAREGDHLFGQTVAAIEKTRVALTRDGVTQWIVLQN